MKNLFLCFALVGMASTLCAQERGDMLVSGSLSWNSSSTKTTVSSTSETTKGSRSFEFTPQFHYFVINKLSVGLGIGYSLEKDPNGRTGSDDEQLFDKKGLFYFQPMASGADHLKLQARFHNPRARHLEHVLHRPLQRCHQAA